MNKTEMIAAITDSEAVMQVSGEVRLDSAK